MTDCETLRDPWCTTVVMGKWHLGEICPECDGPVRWIMWGMPMPEDVERAERKGWIIGGCCIDDRNSMCECGATAYDIDGIPAGTGNSDRPSPA
jgi:hypothetical protein